MATFPEPSDDNYEMIYLENTDYELPQTLNPNFRYTHFKTIARGGKAIIQSCKDRYLSRVICYKKLRSEFATNPIEQQRFLREARVSALLQHPNTVPTYELGRDNKGHYYFTMKLVHGYTLREILDYRERYDLKQLINVVINVAQALDFAHSHHVIHRDIKPENILVGPYGEVLLMDWGLAKVWNPDGSSDEPKQEPTKIQNKKVSSMTDTEKLQGTITYMSPEQLQRDPNIDYRSDIYSLGVVLYEILAGRPPFIKQTVDEISQEILTDSATKPSTHTTARVPDLLEQLTLGCLHKTPENRIQSCSELIRTLEEDW